MSFGWDEEPYSTKEHPSISDAISEVLTKQHQRILFFASASNDGAKSHDCFPARNAQVLSIRATDTYGKHLSSNAALPTSDTAVFGTLGCKVPAACTDKTIQEEPVDGASPATAIAAGMAAVIIGYITSKGREGEWGKIRTHDGFKQLLYNITNASDGGKRFFTLEEFYDEVRWEDLDAHLRVASRR